MIIIIIIITAPFYVKKITSGNLLSTFMDLQVEHVPEIHAVETDKMEYSKVLRAYTSRTRK